MKNKVIPYVLQLAMIAPLGATGMSAQTIATFTVTLPPPGSGLDVPVSADLDDVTVISDSALALEEVCGPTSIPVPFQIGHSGNVTLVVVHTFKDVDQKNVVIRIISARRATKKESLQYHSR
jgi:uncharacterized DUF497 family protein